jgi:hypothetical protein
MRLLHANLIEDRAEFPSTTLVDEVGYNKVFSSEMLLIVATIPSGTLPNP